MKKLLSLILCLAMGFSLAACGGSEAPVTETAPTESEAEPAESVSTPNDEVTVVSVWSGNGHDKEFLNKEIQNWNETEGKEAGIKIDFLAMDWSQINQKLDLAFENGTAPDLFTNGNMAKMAENDQIIALEDIPGGEELVERFRPYLIAGRHQYNGKTYALPKTATTQGLIYNVDMFKAAGLVDENGEATPPKTFAEMREYAKILTNPDKKEFGIIFPGKFSGWYMDDIMSMSMPSGSYMDGWNPKTGEFDFTKMGVAMKTIMGIKEDGSYYPGVENLDNDPARARFGAGGIGMKTSQSYDFGVLTTQFPAEINWAVAPFPVEDENDMHKQYMGVGGYLKINKESVEKIGAEKLMKVFNFFYSPELIRAGYEEGVDIPLEWDLVKDITLPDNMKQWKEFASMTAISQSTPFPAKTNSEGITKLPAIWLNEIWPGNIPVDQIDQTLEEYTQTMNDAAKAYRDENPDYDPAATGVIIPEWDTSR